MDHFHWPDGKSRAIIVTYIISIGNPEGAKNLYMGLNLYSLRQYDFGYYTATALAKAAIVILESYTAYLLIKIMMKIKLSNPFTMEIVKLLEQISYFILMTGVLAIISNSNTKWLAKQLPGLPENLFSGEFIFLAGVVFIISQVFKKGTEIQSENELTV